MNDESNPYDAGEADRTQGSDTGDVFIAPPTEPGEIDDFKEPPRWPSVVGVIGIVWGALGLVCGGLGSAWMMIGPRFMQSGAGQMQGGMPPVMTTFQPGQFALTIVGTVWSLYLIVCGAVCASRKPIARPMTLLWAVVAIALTAVSMKMQLDLQAEIAQWVKDNPTADFSKTQQGPGAAIGRMAGLAFGLIFGLAWPVFCLVWFGVVKTKPEQMTGDADVPAA